VIAKNYFIKLLPYPFTCFENAIHTDYSPSSDVFSFFYSRQATYVKTPSCFSQIEAYPSTCRSTGSLDRNHGTG
jgi:hypothetical protein